ncbi:hypothetical protein Mal33_10780 [Rosistilla oblonga]|uniref:Uncharacterized protein n=1 Tax=Rosistilla oblonga TaxID=2527990 RepID=A0A518IPU0_9BACT|nr:hypothetical protein Mal33_10780 [Rosistilla oblonga]
MQDVGLIGRGTLGGLADLRPIDQANGANRLGIDADAGGRGNAHRRELRFTILMLFDVRF